MIGIRCLKVLKYMPKAVQTSKVLMLAGVSEYNTQPKQYHMRASSVHINHLLKFRQFGLFTDGI
jgi:hypothetical protein